MLSFEACLQSPCHGQIAQGPDVPTLEELQNSLCSFLPLRGEMYTLLPPSTFAGLPHTAPNHGTWKTYYYCLSVCLIGFLPNSENIILLPHLTTTPELSAWHTRDTISVSQAKLSTLPSRSETLSGIGPSRMNGLTALATVVCNHFLCLPFPQGCAMP